MERDELIEEISRRKGIAMEEVAEILDEEDEICLEEEEKFVQQMKKKKRRKDWYRKKENYIVNLTLYSKQTM